MIETVEKAIIMIAIIFIISISLFFNSSKTTELKSGFACQEIMELIKGDKT